MNAKRNRTAGHVWERECAKNLRIIGYEHVVTSRSESKRRDDSGVDLMNKDEFINGRLPWNFQCKSTITLNYLKVLEAMPKDSQINVILHRQSKRAGTVIRTEAEYAVLDVKYAPQFCNYVVIEKKNGAVLQIELKEFYNQIKQDAKN